MRNRWKFTCVFVVAAYLASATVGQQVLTESGTVSGNTCKWAECLQRNPFRCPASGRLALAPPGTCRTLDWHA